MSPARRWTLLLAALPAILEAQRPISVLVFEDRNGNGQRDAGETGIAGVAVSNQRDVAVTDRAGRARIDRAESGIIFVSVPDAYRSVGAFWRAPAAGDTSVAFALRSAPAPRTFTFVHASDPHIEPAKVDRTRRFGALIDSINPAFAIVTGDLIRDAMSQPEAAARAYFDLFAAETKSFATPLWLVPGNHDHFGIIRSRSHVNETHPLFNRGMYRGYFGPDYYSFTYGGVHFVGLNTLAIDDSAYYGKVDSLQLAWLARDLALVPSAMPVVTFDHIPLLSAFWVMLGYDDMALVGALAHADGKTTFRHTVGNLQDVMATMRGHAWPLALGGHIHAAERLVFQTTGDLTRFEQSAAIIGMNQVGDWRIPSGFTLYTVRDGVIDAGRFIPLDSSPRPTESGGRGIRTPKSR